MLLTKALGREVTKLGPCIVSLCEVAYLRITPTLCVRHINKKKQTLRSWAAYDLTTLEWSSVIVREFSVSL